MLRVLVLLSMLAWTPTAAAQTDWPAAWSGKSPMATTEKSRVSLIDHKWFQLAANREFHTPRAWMNIAVNDCRTSNVSPRIRYELIPKRGFVIATDQSYVAFTLHCASSSHAYILPIWDAKPSSVLFDSAVYSCSQYTQDKSRYMIARRAPVSFTGKNDKTFVVTVSGNDGAMDGYACTTRFGHKVSWTDIVNTTLDLTAAARNQGGAVDLDAADQVCVMEQREFARADGGPGAIDYVRVCY